MQYNKNNAIKITINNINVIFRICYSNAYDQLWLTVAV